MSLRSPQKSRASVRKEKKEEKAVKTDIQEKAVKFEPKKGNDELTETVAKHVGDRVDDKIPEKPPPEFTDVLNDKG